MAMSRGRIEGSASGWGRRPSGPVAPLAYLWTATVGRDSCDRIRSVFEPDGPRGLPSDVGSVVVSTYRTHVIPDGVLTAEDMTLALGHDNHAFASSVSAGLTDGTFEAVSFGVVDRRRVFAAGWALRDELLETARVLREAELNALMAFLETVGGFVRVVYWRTNSELVGTVGGDW